MHIVPKGVKWHKAMLAIIVLHKHYKAITRILNMLIYQGTFLKPQYICTFIEWTLKIWVLKLTLCHLRSNFAHDSLIEVIELCHWDEAAVVHSVYWFILNGKSVSLKCKILKLRTILMFSFCGKFALILNCHCVFFVVLGLFFLINRQFANDWYVNVFDRMTQHL